MTMMQALEKAALYEILAMAFRFPMPALSAIVVSGEYAEALDEIARTLGLSTEVSESLACYVGEARDDVFHRLRTEYTKTFVGAPEPLVPAYEGLWRAADDGVSPLLFVNPHSMQVEDFFRRCGMGPSKKNFPLDHLATELEFLQYLASIETGLLRPDTAIDIPENAYSLFFNEHLALWGGRFAARTERVATAPFYQSAASVLGEFIEVERLACKPIVREHASGCSPHGVQA